MTLSTVSWARLQTCDQRLIDLFVKVADKRDCLIIEGHRDKDKQDADFAAGHSKLQWPHGQHNAMPSKAVDAAPLPLDWNNIAAFVDFARVVLEVAAELGIKIRWGGDWNMNGRTDDEKFKDLVHFEVVEI